MDLENMGSKPKTASDLARRILKHPLGGLNKLLTLADREELEWLELKAATEPKGGAVKSGYTLGDYRWHVAKAVVELANSIGGVVLLGLTDDGKPVGIEASDPGNVRTKKGAEAFRRDFLQRVLLRENGWKVRGDKTLKLSNLHLLERSIELDEFTYGEHSVLAIFVDAVPRGIGYVEVETVAKSQFEQKQVFVRQRGAVGKVVELDLNNIPAVQAHEAHRNRYEQEVSTTWERFLSKAPLARPTDALEPEIRQYLSALATQHSSASQFIQLWAEGLPGLRSKPKKTRPKPFRDQHEGWLNDGRKPKHGSFDNQQPKSIGDLECGPVVDLMRKKQQAILVGDAGSGKTACFLQLMLKETENWNSGRVWPLIASLAGYDGGGLSNLLQTSCGLDWEDLVPQIASGSVTLLLDGFNECPDALQDRCASEIANLLAEYPKARAFVSTRSTNIPSQITLPRFEVRPLSRSEQLEFLRHYLHQGAHAEEILRKLYEQPAAASIAGSPILLRIVAEVARETKDIPKGRAALFRRFLETWRRREEYKIVQELDELSWGKEETLQALAELAFQIRQSGARIYSRDQVRNVLKRSFGREVDRFIDWATQGPILVYDEVRNTISFWHETVQEYLCAEYLAARHEDIDVQAIIGNAAHKSGTWSLPIAFTFELTDKLSSTFVDAALEVDPLITAVSLRGSWQSLPVGLEGNLWTHGVVKILLDLDASSEEREASILARTPPKYPLPLYLESTLRSGAFWYAGQSHKAGRSRLDRLKKTMSPGLFPWIELLPAALAGGDWDAKDLSDALRLLHGVSPTPTLSSVLSTATASELCALRRQKKISAERFLTSWARAVARSNGAQRELDLIGVLAAEKEKGRELVPRMLQLYPTELRKIADERTLSLRLLSILVRERVVTAKMMREDGHRLRSIIERMSMMNALRLAKEKVVCREDLTEQDRKRLVVDLWLDKKLREAQKVSRLSDAVSSGLLAYEDIPTDLAGPVRSDAGSRGRYAKAGKNRFTYINDQLSDETFRRRMREELRDRRWIVTVKKVNTEKNFGFATHPDFDGDLHFRLSDIRTGGNTMISRGVALDVAIAPSYNGRRETWSFAVTHGRVR
ncbi:NACHT domain-containing protein [Sulfitobacter mediterraneus]|nr:NACHT domain-containing protein [Sulfitobacter mediterraneus]